MSEKLDRDVLLALRAELVKRVAVVMADQIEESADSGNQAERAAWQKRRVERLSAELHALEGMLNGQTTPPPMPARWGEGAYGPSEADVREALHGEIPSADARPETQAVCLELLSLMSDGKHAEMRQRMLEYPWKPECAALTNKVFSWVNAQIGRSKS